jgi:prephenate dehydrogenase
VADKIVLVGTGLIGGSFALALKKAGAAGTIVGVERSGEALERARALCIVDEGAADWAAALQGAGLVMLAVPVAQMPAVFTAIAPHLEARTVVTDAGSTKSDVIAAARAALGPRIGQFVPGHPIAGAERHGPDAATPGLFQGKKAVLTPLPENAPEAVERVAQAWRACGAQIHTLSAEQHDAVFAAVSHLPHLLAFALVADIAERPDADLLFQYAASGFRDFTRIAASSPEMWRDISLANRPALMRELDRYIDRLQALRTALEAGQGAALAAEFDTASAARKAWGRAIEAAEPRPAPRDE